MLKVSRALRMLGGSMLVAVAMLGCGAPKEGTDSPPAGGASAKKEGLKVGIVFDSGGRGDKSFNDSAWAGIERAKTDLSITESYIESANENDYERNLTAMAEKGNDLVIAVGLNQEKALAAIAPKFPNVKFAIVDGAVTAPNVRELRFKEEEGSYLAGYLAGLVSKTGKLGFVGGMEIDLIKKFLAGYTAGARAANPAIEILPAKYTGNWNDAGIAKEAARTLFSQGADIVYHAAGRAGLGVIDAAKELGKYAIGVDSDQDHIAEGRVLTSMIKRVDEAVFQTIKDLADGKFSAEMKVYDLKANGVGLSEMKFTKDAIGAEKLAKVEEVKAKIAAGEIAVPSSL